MDHQGDIQEYIKIRGAKTNNLKNIDVDIPINKITTIYGASGSGKSSLAFDTLYLESKRRFINSFPNDLKFFWDIPNIVDVDSIDPVLPVWGLAQKNPILTSRWSVLDYLGISEQLKKLFFYYGKHFCPVHKTDLKQRLGIFSNKKLEESGEIFHCFISKSDYKFIFGEFFFPPRTSKNLKDIKDYDSDDPWWEIFKTKGNNFSHLLKKIKDFNNFKKDTKIFMINKVTGEITECVYKDKYGCEECSFSFEKINYEYELSALNSKGACRNCDGHGSILVYDPKKLIKKPHLSIKEGGISILEFKRFALQKKYFIESCSSLNININVPIFELELETLWSALNSKSGKYKGLDHLYDYFERKKYKNHIRIFRRSLQSEVECINCSGVRVFKPARELRFLHNHNHSYQDVLSSSVKQLQTIIRSFKESILGTKDLNLLYLLTEVESIVEMAIDIGLPHLKLKRKLKDLLSSEYQRLLLVKYLSYKGSGSLFVLDEPSSNLSEKETFKVFNYLKKLRDQGNTLVLVDHSEDVLSLSDNTIMLGPKGGSEGGQIIKQTDKYQRTETVKWTKNNMLSSPEWIEVEDIFCDDLPPISFKLPLNCLTWISGESSSFKEKYILNCFLNELYFSNFGEYLFYNSYSYKDFKLNNNKFNKISYLNSSTSKGNSRSTVGTYLGFSTSIRKYFSSLPVSKAMNLKDGHFSANSKLGMCLTCEGKGVIVSDMNFLEDVMFTCDDCAGKKLKKIYADISDEDKSFYQYINLPVSDLSKKSFLTPKLKRTSDYLKMLKIDYLSIDRQLSTLSGGELQRLRILSEVQNNTRDSLLVFENLTFGLSQRELSGLFELMHVLVSNNNTVLVIDQNKHMQSCAHFHINFAINSVTYKSI